MNSEVIYKSLLSVKETQYAIDQVRKTFQNQFSKKLKLLRVTAPLFVTEESKINDGLNGDVPVRFKVKGYLDTELQIVHSLAKWKRVALQKYGFGIHEGIYTDMNAIRRYEILDNTHSFYVDQWDWEFFIREKEANSGFLKKTVKKIYDVFLYVEKKINKEFPVLSHKLPERLTFVTSTELLDMYPGLTPEEREYAFAKKHKAFFVSQIGFPLLNGEPHDKRAFDYDNWKLNGDLIVYDAVNNQALELTSMGIRVDAKALKKQQIAAEKPNSELGAYHMKIYNKELPLSIGGGIGQSRLCMFLLEKKHIGEVQASFWPDDMIASLKSIGVKLL
ncbi:aspartate--ammonia ligase [Mycoplasma phocimorsus]|uniref:aspartate--ammonia ligase n=1 Tax=Mycoplasma phocimorsus TaxID=3045839 RepID=UPI00321FF60A